MRIPRMLAGAVTAAALALTIGGASPAQASVATSITIHWKATAEVFHGKVSSGNSECVAGRTVRVFKKTASGPQLVGKTKSNTEGGWKVSLMAHSGNYFAKTPEQTIMSVDCGAARSNTIEVM